MFDESLLVSVLLNPNLKDLVSIRNHLEVLKITPNDLLQKFIKKYNLTDDEQQMSELPSPSKKWKMDLAQKFETRRNQESSEVDEYLTKGFTEIVDPLDFWKKRPGVLFQLARIVFAQPTSSVPSERLFSSAGRLVTYKRSMLNPLNVEKIMFVKQNYSFCKKKLQLIQ